MAGVWLAATVAVVALPFEVARRRAPVSPASDSRGTRWEVLATWVVAASVPLWLALVGVTSFGWTGVLLGVTLPIRALLMRRKGRRSSAKVEP